MGRIRTALFVTHVCMVTRMPSTGASAPASARMRRSPTDPSRGPADSAAPFSPDHFRRGATRPVSCYALFKWWLPLSQHPGCHCGATSFNPLRARLGALAGGPGCFPFDDGAYPPPSDSRRGARAVFGVRPALASRWGPAADRSLYPRSASAPRLALKPFRREPAITGFDWSFAPIHSSSKPFSTGTGSALRPALPGVRPGHGLITRLRVRPGRLSALFALAFASAPPPA